MTVAELYELYQAHPSVVTDSRKVGAGDIFFALKGPNFNGNRYAEQALQAGAAYVVVDEDVLSGNPKCLLVENVLDTLQQLALYHRKTFDIPFIAITGSNGKTTTKELIHTVLSTKYKTYTTKGNLNNHIGIPLTLLSIKRDAQIAIIEMGANHIGEIAAYCQYTFPTMGIITNCGKAHLEGFGSEEGVRKGKGELFDFLREHGGSCFAFADYPYFADMTKGIKHIYWYSTQPSNATKGLSVIGNIAQSDPFLEVLLKASEQGAEDQYIKTNLVGDYNLPNVLCAALLGRYFKVTDEAISKAIASYNPSNSRSQMIEKGGNKLILDAYNANPSSMQVAIENFSRMQGTHKILLLGGMKELGTQSEVEHQKLIKLIQSIGGWQDVLLIGPEFKAVGAGYTVLTDRESATAYLKKAQLKDSLILIKGSRSNGLEQLLDAI